MSSSISNQVLVAATIWPMLQRIAWFVERKVKHARFEANPKA